MNLKKSASVFMSLAVSSLCLMSLPSYAEDEIISSGDYQYSLDDDEACLMLYTGDDTDIIIPDEIDGYPITSLSETFHDTNVASVTLNNNIEYIDENTFINCYYLTEIIVPDENQFFELLNAAQTGGMYVLEEDLSSKMDQINQYLMNSILAKDKMYNKK